MGDDSCWHKVVAVGIQRPAPLLHRGTALKSPPCRVRTPQLDCPAAQLLALPYPAPFPSHLQLLIQRICLRKGSACSSPTQSQLPREHRHCRLFVVSVCSLCKMERDGDGWRECLSPAGEHSLKVNTGSGSAAWPGLYPLGAPSSVCTCWVGRLGRERNLCRAPSSRQRSRDRAPEAAAL